MLAWQAEMNFVYSYDHDPVQTLWTRMEATSLLKDKQETYFGSVSGASSKMEKAQGGEKVSIVIPMRNEESYIRECLNSLVNQDYNKALLDIIVIDGKSEDSSKQIVQEFIDKFDNISLYENVKKITPVSLNLGIQKATGEIIIVLGAHSYVETDFVTKNLEYLERTRADCVGGTIQTVGKSYQSKAISLAMSSPFGVGNSLFRFSKSPSYVDTVAFGAYRREVFDRIGMFDETLVRNQDYEFNHRLVSNGGKIYLTPDIKSYYYARESIPKLFKQYYSYGCWKAKVVKKHGSAFRFRYQIPPLFILTLLITWIAGMRFPIARYVFFCVLEAYALVLFLVSLRTAIGSRLRYLIALPFAYMSLHFGFGIGFIYWTVKHWFQKGPD
jgi:glycosyltransferase involved in cell wall biosynthesis